MSSDNEYDGEQPVPLEPATPESVRAESVTLESVLQSAGLRESAVAVVLAEFDDLDEFTDMLYEFRFDREGYQNDLNTHLLHQDGFGPRDVRRLSLLYDWYFHYIGTPEFSWNNFTPSSRAMFKHEMNRRSARAQAHRSAAETQSFVPANTTTVAQPSTPSAAQSSPRRTHTVHQFEKAPPYGLKFSNGQWIFSPSDKYPQRSCRYAGCKKRSRTYCICARGKWLCATHQAVHLEENMKTI